MRNICQLFLITLTAMVLAAGAAAQGPSFDQGAPTSGSGGTSVSISGTSAALPSVLIENQEGEEIENYTATWSGGRFTIVLELPAYDPDVSQWLKITATEGGQSAIHQISIDQ